MDHNDNGPLKYGSKISTEIYAATITVQEMIGWGGQGYVYKILYNDEPKALKWFNASKQSQSETFRENLRNNILKGSPDSRFIWPVDITEKCYDSYGYVMDLKPEGYYDLTKFLTHTVQFRSFKQAVDACLNIVHAFRILHNNGYSYQDLNDGNFFIDPNSGRVRIGDNDNVAPNKTSTGVLGKARFMAPEIVLGNGMPDVRSDRFSMALIVFLCLCYNHPLEGHRSITPIMTDKYAKDLYGSHAKFIMDPPPNDNEAVPHIHNNVLTIWPCLPKFVQDFFLRAFSQEALRIPSRRIPEVEWINMLVRLRSSIVVCQCGNEVFIDYDKPVNVCDRCRNQIQPLYILELKKYKIPAVYDTRLYRCQTGVVDAADALKPVAQVTIADKTQGTLGLINRSDEAWEAAIPGQGRVIIQPKQLIPLINGTDIQINGTHVTIKKTI